MIEIITDKFIKTRKYSEELCEPLLTEDYSVQPIEFVSPPKWHLAHTTWFWEEFVLTKYKKDIKSLKKNFRFCLTATIIMSGKE